MPHEGHGVCKFPSGDVYAGEWLRGRREGHGALVSTLAFREEESTGENAAARKTKATDSPSRLGRSAVGGFEFKGDFENGQIATGFGVDGALKFSEE